MKLTINTYLYIAAAALVLLAGLNMNPLRVVGAEAGTDRD